MHKAHKKSIFATIAMCCLAVLMAFAGCGGETDTEHTHSYSSSWSYDDTYHWHECTGEDCDSVSEKDEHDLDDDGVCIVCGYEQESSTDIYSLTITNQGGTAVSGVDVELWTTAGKQVATGTTGTNGAVRFRDIEDGNYYAYIDETTLPKGYKLADDQYSISLTSSNKRVTVAIETSLITDEEMPSGTTYSTGSVVYDYTLTGTKIDTNGNISYYDIKLSEYLDTYGAVFLNFFYTGCAPCRTEMPYMEQAYTDDSLSGKVALICLDYKNNDTESSMQQFMTDNGYSFEFVYDSTVYYGCYGSGSFPTTAIIDKYGCVAEINVGSNVSVTAWMSMFEYYISDSYTPSYTTTRSEDTSSSQVESDVTMPSSEEIEKAIVTNESDVSRFTFSNYSEGGVEDVYNWPWVIGEDTKSNVSDYIVTSNAGIVGGYSIIVIDVSLKKGEAVLFDLYVSTEADYDLFYIQVDTVLQGTYSGDSGKWETCLAYVAQFDGDYQITLYYQKDSSRNRNDDAVYVSNLRISDYGDLETAGITGDILYNAANNYTTAETVNGVDVSTYGEGYGYINYASVYLASDGWYRVDINNAGKTDGADPGDDPYLLADLYYGTPWYSEMSIWDIAYYGTSGSIFDSESDNYDANAYDDIEEYSWVQNNCPWGYVPVNAELHDYLVRIVSESERETYTEYEWLEVCRYYVHYGADHAKGDDCYSLDNLASTFGYKMAVDLGEISSTTYTSNETAYTFTAEIPTLITPRGNYYSFTVETSGVYRIYSYNLETDGDAAPLAYLMDENNNQLAESELDDLAYMDGFYRTGVGGSLTIAADGTATTFTPVYSATYSFTLSGGDFSAAALSDGSGTYYITAGATSYTFSLTLTAGTAYTFVLSGASDDATLSYEITDDAYSFAFYEYLEAGTTYFIAATFGSTEQTGSYDIGIYYLGDELTYFTTLATGYAFTYYEYVVNDITYYEYYLPTRLDRTSYMTADYTYVNSEGETVTTQCWYTMDENGDPDQLIYIDMIGTTWYTYYSNVSIEYAITYNTKGWNTYELSDLKGWLADAYANDDVFVGSYGLTYSMYGCVPAYVDLVEYINELANGNDEVGDSTYASNAWMLAAYYVRTVGANS